MPEKVVNGRCFSIRLEAARISGIAKKPSAMSQVKYPRRRRFHLLSALDGVAGSALGAAAPLVIRPPRPAVWRLAVAAVPPAEPRRALEGQLVVAVPAVVARREAEVQ